MRNFLKNKIYNLRIFGLISTFSFSLVGCNSDDKQKVDQQNWQLSWSDEFNGAAGASPDATKWAYDIGTGNSGWGNQELEYYTNRTENVAMDGAGNLVITAKKENFGGSAYTSARIKTQALFEQTYGRFEARLKTPYGPGIWPAFWMLGSNITTTAWPQCGEIDIMELRGQLPNINNGTIHGPGYSGGNAITGTYALKNSRYDVDYHVFAVEWNADKMDFYVDDYLYQRIEKSDVAKKGEWVYDNPFFLILNIAVGGNFVGFPTEQTPLPQTMTIDYVRVYKQI
ncbi:glycoside hydrolase family 16 protein [Flavobacterium sp.]|uniref:glycoside hydrolase family 16 protein n=1 Tax=Flavobacterium sp. TaxID=239 RepID=UPI00286D0A4E|nr:glycoside hydrolase family 16 protein [Flavobacterium sp.]